MYEKGQGVPQDYAEAVSWYRKAAEQGDAYAQTIRLVRRVMRSRDGEGVIQDIF